MAIVGCRSSIAALVIFFTVRRFHFIWTKAQFGAAFAQFLTIVLFVSATKLTTAANAILLQYTAPVFVALLSSPLLGEKIHRRDWIALGVAIAGMALFFVGDISTEHLLGNVIALVSGLTFAFTAICLRMQKGRSTIESLFLGQVLAALVGLPFLLHGRPPTQHESLLLFVLGTFQLGLPYVFYGIAVRHVSALEATLIPVLEPILNPLWVAIFLGEIPGTIALIGGVIAIGAVLFHGMTSHRSKLLAAPV